MESITNIQELKHAIQLLEIEQAEKAQELREQFYITYESLKPINIVLNTLKEISSSPLLLNNIVGTAAGLATGFLTKKVVVGASSNIFRKILGSLLQVGVTNAVAQHPDAIKTMGQYFFNKIFSKKEDSE